MKKVRVIIIIFSAALASSTLPRVANALSFSTPSDPVSPTSIAHCNDLYQQYSAFAAQLRAQGKQCGDQAWEVAKAGGYWEAKPYYQKCHLIHEEHSAVLSQGSSARLRCTQKVHAHKRRLRQQQELSRKLAINIGKEVSNEPISEATNQALDKARLPELKSALSAYKKVKSHYGLATNVKTLGSGKANWQQQYDSIFGIAGYVAGKRGTHALSDAMLGISLEGVRTIGMDAINQFNLGMREFNQAYQTYQAQLRIQDEQSLKRESDNRRRASLENELEELMRLQQQSGLQQEMNQLMRQQVEEQAQHDELIRRRRREADEKAAREERRYERAERRRQEEIENSYNAFQDMLSSPIWGSFGAPSPGSGGSGNKGGPCYGPGGDPGICQ